MVVGYIVAVPGGKALLLQKGFIFTTFTYVELGRVLIAFFLIKFYRWANGEILRPFTAWSPLSNGSVAWDCTLLTLNQDEQRCFLDWLFFTTYVLVYLFLLVEPQHRIRSLHLDHFSVLWIRIWNILFALLTSGIGVQNSSETSMWDLSAGTLQSW